MKKTVCSFGALVCVAGVANSADMNNGALASVAGGVSANEQVKDDVKIDDVARIIVGKNEELDVKAQASQIRAALASNPERARAVDGNAFLTSIVQARVFEYVLAEAAKKINLQNDPMIKNQIEMAMRQILVRAYVGRVMSDRIKPDDVQKAYEEYKKGFEKPIHGIEIGHILVKDEATAKEVIAALDRKEKFEDVAKKYSIANSKDRGGHEDVLPVDALPPQMQVLKGLNVGEHAKEAFRSPLGFHIVAVLAKKNVEAQPLEKVQRMLEQSLFKSELEKLTQTLLKTISVKGYNDAGKEINIMPLLMKRIEHEAVQPKAQSAPASEVTKTPTETTTPAKEKTKPVEAQKQENQEKKNEKSKGSVDVSVEDVEEDTDEEEGVVSKFVKWIKSFF